jgi:hypothetical protein
MRFRLDNRKAFFQYGSSSATELTILNINDWYQKLGGTIEDGTEIEFVPCFPGSLYERTALTERMPQAYLCEGSGSAVLYKPGGQVDYLSISIYRDTTPDALSTSGYHHNLFLQYKIGAQDVTHTDHIPNRHLALSNDVVIKGFLDNEQMMNETIRTTSTNR